MGGHAIHAQKPCRNVAILAQTRHLCWHFFASDRSPWIDVPLEGLSFSFRDVPLEGLSFSFRDVPLEGLSLFDQTRKMNLGCNFIPAGTKWEIDG